MVQSVEIVNFRGFERLKVDDLALINLIVGDNAVGKTAFLEALYLALSGNAEKGLALKQFRGANAGFQTGVLDSVAEGIYGDLFHNSNSSIPITISLTGRGFENRKVVISRTRGEIVVPVSDNVGAAGGNRRARRAAQSKRGAAQVAQLQQATTVPISLVWTDEHGNEHSTRVSVSPTGLTFEGTGEQLPSCSMYAAQIQLNPEEAANNYSALRKTRETDLFRKIFLSTFDQIRDISVESEASGAALLADIPWANQLIFRWSLEGRIEPQPCY
jgi:hypothetical protein